MTGDGRNRGRPRCIRARHHHRHRFPSQTIVVVYRCRLLHRRRHPRRDGGSRDVACLIQDNRIVCDWKFGRNRIDDVRLTRVFRAACEVRALDRCDSRNFRSSRTSDDCQSYANTRVDSFSRANPDRMSTTPRHVPWSAFARSFLRYREKCVIATPNTEGNCVRVPPPLLLNACARCVRLRSTNVRLSPPHGVTAVCPAAVFADKAGRGSL